MTPSGGERGAAAPGIRARRRDLAELVALNTTLLAAGRVFVAASGIVAVAASTRYLGRDDFGELTIALAFVAVFTTLTDFGLWTVSAREIAKRPGEERRILDSVFTLGLLLTGATLVVAAVATFTLYGGAGRGNVREAIAIVGLQLLLTAPAGTANAFMTAHQRAGPIALASTAASVVLIAGVALVVALDLGFAMLAGAYAVAAAASSVVPTLAMLRDIRPRLSLDRALAMQIARWAVPQGGVLILSILYFRIDTVILSVLSSDGEVALYGVAYRVLEALAVLPVYFMATLFPEFARAEPWSQRLYALAQGALSLLSVAAIAMGVLMAAFAADMVAVVAGEEFARAVPVLQLLGAAVAITFANAAFFHALVALNRQRDLLVMLAAVLGANVALNCALAPIWGARGAAVALILTDAIALLLAARAYRRIGELPRPRRPVRLGLAAAAMAAAAVAAHELGEHLAAPRLATIAVGAPLAVAVYLGTLYVVRAVPPELERLLGRLATRARAALRVVRSEVAS